MKLFLISKCISAHDLHRLEALTGKPAKEIRLAHIIDAADTYPVEKRSFVAEQQENFKDLDIAYDDIRLADMDTSEIEETLSGYDVIWAGGGNSWYLRYVLKSTGADGIVRKLVEAGKVYGGGSAGAVVATPTLRHFDLADNPDDSPERIEDGLGLIDYEIVPHWGNPKYADILMSIKANLESEGYKVVTLADGESLVVDD